MMKKIRKTAKYGVPMLAGFLAFGGCNLDRQTHPVDGIGTYTANYETLRADYGNDFWKLTDSFMKEEGEKTHGMTEGNAKASRIIRAYNQNFENPFLYKGKITLPDLNHDGRVLGRPVNGKYNSQKTVPRAGKR